MKALRVDDFNAPIRCVEIDPPGEPGPGQVRVRLAAAGISFFDLLISRGGYQVKPPLPFIPGSEWAGTVEAVGPPEAGASDSAPWRVGQRVCGTSSTGAWAEQWLLPAGALHAVADGVSLEEAAVLIMPYGTSLYALRERGALQPGETVLVGGATGSIGLAAVELAARVMGARVIATAGRAEQAAALKRLGADAVVDARAPDLKDQVKALAGPRGVDVVLDPVGGDFTDAAFRTLGWNGRHLVVGFASGAIGSLKANLTIVKGGSLIGVDLRQLREREPAAAQRLFADVAALHQAGRLKPVVGAVHAFADAARAFEAVQQRQGLGRVLLRPR